MQTKKIITLSFFLMSIALHNTAHGMKREREISPFLLQAAQEAGKIEELTPNFTKVKTVKRIRNKPPKATIYCEECIFVTKYDVNMKAHRGMHLKMKINPDKVYGCTDCGYLTERRCFLKQHCTTHEDEENYLCDHCGFATKTPENLQRHIKNRHENFPVLL